MKQRYLFKRVTNVPHFHIICICSTCKYADTFSRLSELQVKANESVAYGVWKIQPKQLIQKLIMWKWYISLLIYYRSRLIKDTFSFNLWRRRKYPFFYHYSRLINSISTLTLFIIEVHMIFANWKIIWQKFLGIPESDLNSVMLRFTHSEITALIRGPHFIVPVWFAFATLLFSMAKSTAIICHLVPTGIGQILSPEILKM